ncbi:LOW QUALITY PROTEIN: interferon epsilon [Alexandromys fortis]|uniref:LOW QUALITY PROTEIN: interferon epsilon n=1 Tax=Alexandromys fortis TaxID=100897 RepID=UPI00215375D1|nr:LOW QUALITY PROTEIN: interferon epsilon [Microtus fortis]
MASPSFVDGAKTSLFYLPVEEQTLGSSTESFTSCGVWFPQLHFLQLCVGWDEENGLETYFLGHALAVLHEILRQIFSLFQTYVLLGVWEENHLERVLAALHQQLKYVESLTGRQAEQKSSSLSVQNLRLQIKAYFRRIHDYLEKQRSNSCARVIVQIEANRCMFFVLRLTGWLSKQTRPLNTVKRESTVDFKGTGGTKTSKMK